jgi:hypothetical protein
LLIADCALDARPSIDSFAPTGLVPHFLFPLLAFNFFPSIIPPEQQPSEDEGVNHQQGDVAD